MRKVSIKILSSLLLSGFWALDGLANYIVELQVPTKDELSALANIIHMDSVHNGTVFSVVNDHDLQILKHQYAPYIMSIEAIDSAKKLSEYYRPFVNIMDFPMGDEPFHTYDEMTSELNALALEFPDSASVFSIGKSVQGRDLWGIKIGPQDSVVERRSIVIMGTHHAREHVSTEIPLRFARDLLESQSTNADVGDVLSNIDVYIIPMVNPDGAMHDISGTGYKWWRKNRKRNKNGSYGVDLNRNYGYGWGTGGSSRDPSSDIYMGEKAFSESETQNVRDFIQNTPNVTLALSFHTYSELILYPWGGKDEGVGGEDELLYKQMAGDMAAMNDYTPMQSSELYIASGDTCDWAYGALGIYCFTFELSPSSMGGGGFYPGASVLDQVYNDNYGPLMYMLAHTSDPKSALRTRR